MIHVWYYNLELIVTNSSRGIILITDRPNYNFIIHFKSRFQHLCINPWPISNTWAIDPEVGISDLMIWGATWERVYKCTRYMISEAVYYHKCCILQLYCHRYCMYRSIGTDIHISQQKLPRLHRVTDCSLPYNALYLIPRR